MENTCLFKQIKLIGYFIIHLSTWPHILLQEESLKNRILCIKLQLSFQFPEYLFYFCSSETGCLLHYSPGGPALLSQVVGIIGRLPPCLAEFIFNTEVCSFKIAFASQMSIFYIVLAKLLVKTTSLEKSLLPSLLIQIHVFQGILGHGHA